MKTSVMEVHDMLSILSVDGVEKRIGEVPGVESVTVNFAAGSATVRYDETRLELAGIRSAVRQRGYAPAEPAAGEAGESHGGHMPSPASTAAAPPTPPAPTAAKAPAPAAAKAPTPTASADHQHDDKTVPDKTVPDKPETGPTTSTREQPS